MEMFILKADLTQCTYQMKDESRKDLQHLFLNAV